MAMPHVHDNARTAISSLRLIFWGGLLCIFDIAFTMRSGHSGYRLDLLNDFVGMIMIGCLYIIVDRLIVQPIENVTVARWGLLRK